MAISENPRFEAFIRCLQGGQITVTHLRYAAPDDLVTRSAAQCALWLWADIGSEWRDACSDQLDILDIEVNAWTGLVWENAVLNVGESGNVIGEALPVYNSMALVKYPDNATIDPVGAQPFTKGRVAMPGVPESFQDNNTLTVAARAIYDALAAALLDFDNTGVTYSMFLFRGEDTLIVPNPPAWVEVASVASNKLGTQNTRKR